jgi:Phage portal protein
MAEFNLIKRMSNAYRALRREQKAASNAPDFSGSGYYDNRLSDYHYRWNWNRSRATVDYRAEVGSLDGHSLVACVFNYTGTRLPEAKPVVKRTNENGEVKIDPNHALAQLIRRPNNHHIWANYSQASSIDWWIDGGVHFKKVRDRSSQLRELWHIPYYMIRPRWPGDNGSPPVPQEEGLDPFLSHYQFDRPGKSPELWPANDVLHLKRGALGENRRTRQPFEPLIKELYGDDKMALFTAAIMKNMGIQVPLISPKDKDTRVDREKALQMKEMWMQKTAGDRAGEPVIMLEPVDVEKFGFNPDELDLSRLRLIPESRVSAVTGIPAATLQLLVGLENGTSYASSEQARQQGYEEVVIPIQQVWAEEINWQLKPEYDDLEDAEFWFDTSNVRVLEEDKDALFKRESEVFRTGGTTVDQFFTAIGKKPIGAPLGDIRMVPGLASPMSPERLLEAATMIPEPVAPTDPQALAKLMDIDRMLAGFEQQMKGFELPR